MLRLVILASLAFAGCKKTEPAGSQAAAATKQPAGAASPSPSPAPVAVTAQALFDEHVAAGGLMPDLGHKYDAGVLVTGTVGNVITDLGTTFVHLKAGEGKRVALTFVDQGADARAKGVKIGDPITARCKLGGMSGDVEAILGDCTLR
jgi:hypothetical protein